MNEGWARGASRGHVRVITGRQGPRPPPTAGRGPSAPNSLLDGRPRPSVLPGATTFSAASGSRGGDQTVRRAAVVGDDARAVADVHGRLAPLLLPPHPGRAWSLIPLTAPGPDG